MIKIDGRTFDVPVVEVGRKADFLYKFANRTEDGILHKEEIAVYMNFSLGCENVKKNSEYSALWKKLIEIPNTHMVTLWDDDGEFTQESYFSGISDSLNRIDDKGVRYNNLKFQVIAIKPHTGVSL